MDRERQITRSVRVMGDRSSTFKFDRYGSDPIFPKDVDEPPTGARPTASVIAGVLHV